MAPEQCYGADVHVLSPEAISQALTTRWVGRRLIFLHRTASTNDVAKEAALGRAEEGTLVLAEEQTAGRGRWGRRWISPPGCCLLLSLAYGPMRSVCGRCC